MLDDSAPPQKRYSLVRYQGELVGVSLFVKSSDDWLNSYFTSSPVTLRTRISKEYNVIRGFGMELQKRGIIAIRELDQNAEIAGEAISSPAAAIYSKLGFQFLGKS